MLDNVDKEMDQADSILTKLTNIIKKHWLVLILLVLCYCAYEFINMVKEEVANPTQTEEVSQDPTNSSDSDDSTDDDSTDDSTEKTTDDSK